MPVIVLLIGFPGTGKLTVAKALQARLQALGSTVRLLDNHYINNPILNLIQRDGHTPFPPGTQSILDQVRYAVVETIATLSPPDWSFIFTNYLVETPKERLWVSTLDHLAESRHSLFVPVRLLCDLDELLLRVQSPERLASLKNIDPALLSQKISGQQVLDPQTPATLTLNITSMSPEAAAQAILDHIAALPQLPL